MIKISVGNAFSFALPWSEETVLLLVKLISKPVFIEEYKSTSVTDFSRVWCKPGSGCSIQIIDPHDVFYGTIDEYRRRSDHASRADFTAEQQPADEPDCETVSVATTDCD
jgi:hypothetical protein